MNAVKTTLDQTDRAVIAKVFDRVDTAYDWASS
jgi:hypothetical protein